MKTKITITVLCIMSWLSVSAQKTEAKNDVKKIIFDYNAQSFTDDKFF